MTERRAKAKIPELGRVQDQARARRRAGRAGGRLGASPRRRCSATRPTATTRRCASGSHDAGREYVLAVGAATKVFAPETVFAVPEQAGRARAGPRAGQRPDREARDDRRPDRQARQRPDAQTVAFRDGPDGKPITSRFVFVRVRAAHDWREGNAQPAPRGTG